MVCEAGTYQIAPLILFQRFTSHNVFCFDIPTVVLGVEQARVVEKWIVWTLGR